MKISVIGHVGDLSALGIKNWFILFYIFNGEQYNTS